MFTVLGYLVALKSNHQREAVCPLGNHWASEWMQQIKEDDADPERPSRKEQR